MTDSPPDPVQELISQISQSAAKVFKFGTGLMGKSAIVTIVLIIVCGVVIFSKVQSEDAVLIGLGGLALTVLALMFPYMRAAWKNPEKVAMEGWQIVESERIQAASKISGPLSNTILISNPATPAPQIDQVSEKDQDKDE